MKRIINLRFMIMPAMLIFFVTISNSQPRPGIECGCENFGDYLSPACKTLLVEEGSVFKEGFSAKTESKIQAVC